MAASTMGNRAGVLVALLGALMMMSAPMGADATYRKFAVCPPESKLTYYGFHAMCISTVCEHKCVKNETCEPGIIYKCVCPYQRGSDKDGNRTCIKTDPDCGGSCTAEQTCEFNGTGGTECKTPDLPATWLRITTQGNATGTHHITDFKQSYKKSSGRWFFN